VRECLLSFDAEPSVLHFLPKNIKINLQNYSFLVVLYGYEAWSLTLREERRLRVSVNRVLRKIFGPKWDVVTVEWKTV